VKIQYLILAISAFCVVWLMLLMGKVKPITPTSNLPSITFKPSVGKPSGVLAGKVVTPVKAEFSKKEIKDLEAYNTEKKNTVFFKDTKITTFGPDYASKRMLERASLFISKQIDRPRYSSTNENLSILLVDYLVDAAKGKIEFENPDQAKATIINLLFKNLEKGLGDLKGLSKDDKKFFIGNKIDLMAAYTQVDKEGAKELLQEQKEKVSKKEYKYLADGYENGIYLSDI